MLNRIGNLSEMRRYIKDWHYIGPAKFNIMLDRAKELYEETKNDSIDEITEEWKKMIDSAISDSNIKTLMRSRGWNLLAAESFSDDDATGKFILSKCYEYVIAKRYEEA